MWHKVAMLAAPLLISLLAALAVPTQIAVLAGRAPGDDATEALDAAPTFGQGLQTAGIDVLSGPKLWSALGGGLREVGGELPTGTERLLDGAALALDEGRYADAAKLAQDAAARLDRAARSVAVEARQRAAEVLCGLALTATDQAAIAAPHLFWALARDPAFAVDSTRFSPPQRLELEAARRAAALRPRGPLAVRGAEGASVYVDGLLAGQVPLALTGVPRHAAWVWLERAGRRSLAHRVDLAATAAVSIDLDLEARLGRGSEGRPIFSALAGDPETPRLLERLAAALGVPAAAVLSRCAGAGCWQLDAVASGRTISLQREVGVAKAPPLEELARSLLAELGGAPAPPAAEVGSKLTSEEPPVAAVNAPTAPPSATAAEAHSNVARPAKAWPWVVAAAAVVAVGTGVGLYFALRSSTDVGLYFAPGSP